MKHLAAACVVLVSGCAMTPDRMAAESDYRVCWFAQTPAQGQVAHQEIQRRRLDCSPYLPAIAAERAGNNAVIQQGLTMRQQAQPAQRPMHCTAVRSGNVVNTVCN